MNFSLKKNLTLGFFFISAVIGALSYWLIEIYAYDGEPLLRGYIFLVGIVLGGFAFYVFSVKTLMPISILRKMTEDILAGRFELSVNYESNDDLGRTFEALSLLCKEFDKKEELLAKYSELAIKDGLTGVYNHRKFKEEYLRELKRAQRNNLSLGVLILDLDHFKKLNDTYGHLEGDRVLKKVAEVISETIRDTDLVARYGGEEFVVLLTETDYEGIVIGAERIRTAIERIVFEIEGGKSFRVTTSVGGVELKGKNVPPDVTLIASEIIKSADKNLYQAKEQGRNQVIVLHYPDRNRTIAA